MNFSRQIIQALLLVTAVLSATTCVSADDKDKTKKEVTVKKRGQDLSSKLRDATRRTTTQSYLLKYKFETGQTLRWKSEHKFRTETKGKGERVTSSGRITSTKKWYVKKVNKNGTVSIVYSIEDRNDWTKVSGQEETHFDSTKDSKVPPIYKQLAIAEKVGIPLATAELDFYGNVLSKNATYRDVNLGMGKFAFAVPKTPIEIGDQWTQDEQIRVRLESGGMKMIKTQKLMKLISVEDEVATISIRTEVLTPVREPAIKNQIMQQVTFGKAEFDIKEGRLLSQTLDWDHEVQGYPTGDSIVKYQAEKSEQFFIKKETPTARLANDAGRALKAPNEGPILRF